MLTLYSLAHVQKRTNSREYASTDIRRKMRPEDHGRFPDPDGSDRVAGKPLIRCFRVSEFLREGKKNGLSKTTSIECILYTKKY